jgi:hypothetical protein
MLENVFIEFGTKRSGIGAGDLDFSVTTRKVEALGDEELDFLKRLIMRVYDIVHLEQNERFYKKFGYPKEKV